MRADLELIYGWVAEDSHILDLGCGDGTLLDTLARDKGVTGYGLEIDPGGITDCIGKGISVIEHDIDDGLGNFDDDTFDLVIMTQALQALQRPDHALDEMMRVASECIITFPNFAYWRHRFHLGFKGFMPVSKSLPYAWYNTPNIHLSTFNDFECLCKDKGLIISDRAVGNGEHEGSLSTRLWPNLFGETAIFRVSRGDRANRRIKNASRS